MNTREEVFETFSKLVGIERESLLETTVIADVVVDSLKYFELFLELERGLGKKLSFEQVASITTLGDVITFIETEKNVADSEK